MGTQKTKIEVIKKISDHPIIIIYEKKHFLNIYFNFVFVKCFYGFYLGLKKALLANEEYIPNIVDIHITKQIQTLNLSYI